MSSDNGIVIEDPDFLTTSNYNHVDANIIDANIIDANTGDVNPGQSATNYGKTSPASHNENIFYDEVGSLFNRQLILVKEFKSPFDIRYKTDYFPRGGQHAGVPQKPRYLRTVDDDQEAVIKFPNGYVIPQNPGNYFLETALLTVPRVNQHYMHVNKFQLNHTNVNVLDENPYFTRLTLKHFEEGEIKIKLVINKTQQRDFENIASLPLFGNQTSSGWTAACKSVDDLRNTYELNHARVAFSLGYMGTNGQFIRFTNTTVISNEIIEKEKSKPVDEITCPHCSHSFSIKEQKQNNRKRSASSSNSTGKKRSSLRKQTTSN